MNNKALAAVSFPLPRGLAALKLSVARLVVALLVVSSALLLSSPALAVAPTVSITSPTTGSSFTSPATVALSANAIWGGQMDVVQSVDFYNGATLIGTATRTSGNSFNGVYTFSWTGVTS